MSEKQSVAAGRPTRKCRKASFMTALHRKRKSKEKESQVRAILKKGEAERSSEDQKIIKQNKKVVKVLEKRAHLRELNRQKLQEVEDSAEDLGSKVAELAEVIRSTENLVVYTGAGISTAASIPDYRGPNGVWTLLQQGKESSLRNSSLVDAEPTLTHMALARLVDEGIVRHIVSQNCDGLHLRSGIPPDKLSELHGNMYIEVCTECEPERQYIRLFDVTEQTSLRRHKTSRECHKCQELLRDTIVHFGEKGVVEKPLNWSGAMNAADDAQVILCLGSSLKVLRRYQCLWATDRPKSQRPDLYIVNLQWTPKDSQASLKIHGRCDDVMSLLMKFLNLSIPHYARESDPIFKIYTPLRHHEEGSYSTKSLSNPSLGFDHLEQCMQDDSKSEQYDSDDTIPVSIPHSDSDETEEEDKKKVTVIPRSKEGVLDKDTKLPEGFGNLCRDRNLDGYKIDNENEEKIPVILPLQEGDIQEGNMPGWFGKGCRKKAPRKVGKRRRRSRVSSADAET